MSNVRLLPSGTPALSVDASGRLMNMLSRDWYRYLIDLDRSTATSTDSSLLNFSPSQVGEIGFGEEFQGSDPSHFTPLGTNEEPDQSPPFPGVLDWLSLEERLEAVETLSNLKPVTEEPLIDSGTYTPTLTNVANLDASTTRQATWMRVGGTVTVSGQLDIDPTAGATLTSLGISLPIPSAFTTAYQLGGTACAIAIAGQCAGIQADVANARASMQWMSANTTNQIMTYTFQYELI